MPKEKIAFLKSNKLRKIARYFIGVGDILSKISPYTTISLQQSGVSHEYNVSVREYFSVCFTITLFLFIGSAIAISGALSLGGGTQLFYGPLFGIIVSGFAYIQLISYPKVIVGRRTKDIERNLLFVLRTLLVQIRAGIPIFDTFLSIATGNYGEISKEFTSVIEKARAGESVIDGLEELTIRNPSIHFRRAIWQLLNALKSGSDVGDNLENVIEALSKEQLVEIRQYKSILNPLAMMYMMVAVIAPSLGITILIILSTFPGMEEVGKEQTFWVLLGGVVFMQFMFMSIIKSKRPNLLGS